MFYFLEDFDIANYVGDSTSYCAGKSAEFALNQTITFIYYFQVTLELPLRLTIVILNRKTNKYY